jgi:hypothetical protein
MLLYMSPFGVGRRQHRLFVAVVVVVVVVVVCGHISTASDCCQFSNIWPFSGFPLRRKPKEAGGKVESTERFFVLRSSM